jgi:hypothetical protein
VSLKYLFRAQYTDGTFLRQTEEDVSSTKAGGSAFSDVDHTRLESFFLSNGSQQIGVDLRDGTFWVNDVKFYLHDPDDMPGEGPVRLYYFRRTWKHFNVRQEEIACEVHYRLGWERDDGNGGTVSRVMEVI